MRKLILSGSKLEENVKVGSVTQGPKNSWLSIFNIFFFKKKQDMSETQSIGKLYGSHVQFHGISLFTHSQNYIFMVIKLEENQNYNLNMNLGQKCFR